MFRPDAAADGEEYRNFQSNLGSQDVYFDILILFSKIGQISRTQTYFPFKTWDGFSIKRMPQIKF